MESVFCFYHVLPGLPYLGAGGTWRPGERALDRPTGFHVRTVADYIDALGMPLIGTARMMRLRFSSIVCLTHGVPRMHMAHNDSSAGRRLSSTAPSEARRRCKHGQGPRAFTSAFWEEKPSPDSRINPSRLSVRGPESAVPEMPLSGLALGAEAEENQPPDMGPANES